MLELKSISKKYGVTRALKDVSLTLPQGQIVGLFGENGAGKTTLMKCILGLLSYGGTITLDGASINEKNIERLSFATCEHSFFPALTPKGHRDFYQAHFPRFNDKRFHALMDFFELPMNKPLRAFSAGMKNQFEVVMALSQGADYILMDEPFAALDHFTRTQLQKELIRLQKSQNTGILFVTHSIDEALLLGHKIAFLEDGCIKKEFLLDTDCENRDLLSKELIELKREILAQLHL